MIHIHYLIEGVRKYLISSAEAQAEFYDYCDSQGPYDEAYTDRSKLNKEMGAAAVSVAVAAVVPVAVLLVEVALLAVIVVESVVCSGCSG